MTRAGRSAEPWVNQSQSNRASSSRYWTAAGASQCLKHIYNGHINSPLSADDLFLGVKCKYLTVVKPAILKAVQRVEQRHVEEANHLPNGVDGEEANNHTLQDHENADHN